MESTSPRANRHPHAVQYTPNDKSIERSVLAFVNPRSSSLPLVSANNRTTFSFHSRSPIAPSPAAAFPAGLFPRDALAAGLAGEPSDCAVNSAILALMI